MTAIQSSKIYFIKVVQSMLIYMYQLQTNSSLCACGNFMTYLDVIFRVLKLETKES